ncbi:Mannose-1-phosphate guanylyltransferase [Caulifigura coniformis]|uniref:mannose-1-phosphate guanylyltransferase n=1 Tax=Caulifigura coniformis TaxID=2527983 RepID=A0A517SB49_9PLAN|nr:mannose-1-phosphate guanylyltransferase [Caulifigura coniformis]QDT53367.1 Mannose-1-phosphate guanylyltransferase [Caulifigura coniformis]
MLHAVIMAGGSGTRFWPASRHAFPKQFLTLSGDRSLIQSTSDRCIGWIPAERQWVVTNEAQAAETRRQLPELPTGHVLVEPCARNTAPCVALAAAHLLKEDPDAVMLLLPADHVIQPVEAFEKAGKAAQTLVDEDRNRLVLFGVTPTFPSTGYGYIERGPQLGAGRSAYHVAAFREKPDRPTAETYLKAGTFYWNCGIFTWSARRILEAITTYEPEIGALTAQVAGTIGAPGYDATIRDLFPKMKSTSIDYAVLERDKSIVVLEAPFGWDDVGSWEAVPRLSGSDAAGNTIEGLHVGVDTKNCIVRTTDKHLVATLGLEDCIVVHTPDATLVAKRGDENAIKKLIEELKTRGLNGML